MEQRRSCRGLRNGTMGEPDGDDRFDRGQLLNRRSARQKGSTASNTPFLVSCLLVSCCCKWILTVGAASPSVSSSSSSASSSSASSYDAWWPDIGRQLLLCTYCPQGLACGPKEEGNLIKHEVLESAGLMKWPIGVSSSSSSSGSSQDVIISDAQEPSNKVEQTAGGPPLSWTTFPPILVNGRCATDSEMDPYCRQDKIGIQQCPTFACVPPKSKCTSSEDCCGGRSDRFQATLRSQCIDTTCCVTENNICRSTVDCCAGMSCDVSLSSAAEDQPKCRRIISNKDSSSVDPNEASGAVVGGAVSGNVFNRRWADSPSSSSSSSTASPTPKKRKDGLGVFAALLKDGLGRHTGEGSHTAAAAAAEGAGEWTGGGKWDAAVTSAGKWESSKMKKKKKPSASSAELLLMEKQIDARRDPWTESYVGSGIDWQLPDLLPKLGEGKAADSGSDALTWGGAGADDTARLRVNAEEETEQSAKSGETVGEATGSSVEMVAGRGAGDGVVELSRAAFLASMLEQLNNMASSIQIANEDVGEGF